MNNENPKQTENRETFLLRKYSSFMERYIKLETNLRQYTPGDTSFQKHTQREIINILKENIKKFKQLKILDEETKKEIFPLVRSHLKAVAYFEGLRKTLSGSIGVFSVFNALLLPSLLTPILTPKLFHFAIPWYILLIYYVPFLMISSQLYNYSIRFTSYILKLSNIIVYFSLYVFMLVVQGLLIYLAIRIPIDSLAYALSTLLIINEAALVIFLSNALIASVFFWVWARSRFIKSPNSFMSRLHLNALSILEKEPPRNNNQVLRKQAAEDLLLASRDALTYLPKFLKVKDARLNFSIENLSAEISSGIRGMAKSVVISGDKQFEELRSQLAKNFLALINASFSDCITAPPAIISKQERQQIIRKKLTTFIIGVFPLFVFVVIRYTSLISNISLLDYPIIISGIWFISQLVTIIDSTFIDRLKAFKDIVSLFSSKP